MVNTLGDGYYYKRANSNNSSLFLPGKIGTDYHIISTTCIHLDELHKITSDAKTAQSFLALVSYI